MYGLLGGVGRGLRRGGGLGGEEVHPAHRDPEVVRVLQERVGGHGAVHALLDLQREGVPLVRVGRQNDPVSVLRGGRVGRASALGDAGGAALGEIRADGRGEGGGVEGHVALLSAQPGGA